MTITETEHSFNGMRWQIKEYDSRLARTLQQRFQIPDIVARIMASRNITLDNAEAFLKPTLRQHLPNPFSLKDMRKAAERMAEAIINSEPIGLMGDYDVDGATSTALLKMFLEKCNITVHCFIPDREDGYGPNAGKMKEYKEAGCNVVATLDCGMTAFEPIEYGTQCGLDVIVLDHHDADETRLPNAYAVVNPKRLDEDINHPCHYMAAVGVVFLFTVGLNAVLREKGFYQNRSEPNLMEFLDLVAFGTVCDVVKLQGVNRLFVKSGLKQMQLGKNLGLRALSELVKLEEAPTAYHLGYVFGPRINACGRVGKSDIGMRLLSSYDLLNAQVLAQELEELNTHRREIETQVLNEAMAQVESESSDTPFIVVQGDNWHQGVVGIVAGRLKDKYNLPVFALSIENDEVKGSSRSVQGVDLGTLVMNAIQKGILSRGGGHPMAAGFSLKPEKLSDFKAYLKEHIKPDMIGHDCSTIMVDGILSANALTDDLMNHLATLAPFGESNPEPLFIIKDVLLTRVTLLKNGHISCTLSAQNGKNIHGIAFRAADTPLGTYLQKPQNRYMHVLGVLKKDTWKGRTKIQLQISDAVFA